ncbi:hypothetical protein [Vreelandella jeotgali]|uniref:hypothetical protein n=1 Tax=Vreelandella jeotgali TaxID=553386 RepID=UPI0012EAFFF3|nr:hypothetical protein [Halomonas jeotgali]
MKIEEIENVFDDAERRVFKLGSDCYILIVVEGDADVCLIDKPDEEYVFIKRIGGFIFSPVEDPNGDYFKVINMDLSEAGKGFLRKGIGEKIVEIKEDLCGPVVFGNACGFSSQDGSHLIDDGLPFAEAMMKKKAKRNKLNS